MAVKHKAVLVGNTATSLTAGTIDTDTAYEQSANIARSILVQNSSGATVYLGGPGVTAGDYGYALAAGGEIAIDLTPGDELFAVAAAPQTIYTLHLGV